MTLEYNSTTTLRRIREAKPRGDGWKKLLAHLGKTEPDDEPLDLLTVLDSNGYDDAFWVLSYAMPDRRLERHFQAWCAEQVLHIYEAQYPNDRCIRDRIAMLRNDSATEEERQKARKEAWIATASAEAAAKAAKATEAAKAAAWAARAAGWGVLAAEAAVEATTWSAIEATRSAQEAQLRKMLTQEATQ
jgi:hypothetical protein